MWLKILNDINDRQSNKDLNYLNLRFDLHVGVYVIEILKDIINFEILDDKLVIQDKDENILSNDEFFYWWQITRYNDVYNEEMDIINKMKEVEQTITKLKRSIENIKDDKKQKKIDEIETKIAKLTNYLMKENSNVKNKLTVLSNFRNMINTRESNDKVLDSIKIYLTHNN